MKKLKFMIKHILILLSFSISYKTKSTEDLSKNSDQNPNIFILQVRDECTNQTEKFIVETTIVTNQYEQEIFAIRKDMIDECINQYKVLSKWYLSYGQLWETCSKLNNKYDYRVAFNKCNKVYGDKCGNIYETWLMTDDGRAWLNSKKPKVFFEDNIIGLIFKHYHGVKKYQDALKVDVIESMEIYERLYGHPHPRKNEFSKM